ncbi:hypothetical protein NC652_014046 [Populus alba x Populus x berolinensis]|nr:hypothetical protein NC652_014046 [Populus alba x Populus x berolinensis]
MNLGIPFSLGLPPLGPCLFAKGIHGFCFTRSLPLRHCPSDQKQRINTSCQLANALVFVSPGNQTDTTNIALLHCFASWERIQNNHALTPIFSGSICCNSAGSCIKELNSLSREVIMSKLRHS